MGFYAPQRHTRDRPPPGGGRSVRLQEKPHIPGLPATSIPDQDRQPAGRDRLHGRHGENVFCAHRSFRERSRAGRHERRNRGKLPLRCLGKSPGRLRRQQPAAETSAVGNRYLWQGQRISWKTGLYYFRTRWYDPITGRFLSNDPIGISGGLDQYVFAGNNPVNFRDPFGLCSDDDPSWYDRLGDWWNRYSEWAESNRESARQSYPVLMGLFEEMESSGVGPCGMASGAGRLNQLIQRGRAPQGIERAERGHVPGQESHVHYEDGTSSTQSGKIHDAHKGIPSPSNAIRDWLKQHGCPPPKQ